MQVVADDIFIQCDSEGPQGAPWFLSPRSMVTWSMFNWSMFSSSPGTDPGLRDVDRPRGMIVPDMRDAAIAAAGHVSAIGASGHLDRGLPGCFGEVSM